MNGQIGYGGKKTPPSSVCIKNNIEVARIIVFKYILWKMASKESITSFQKDVKYGSIKSAQLRKKRKEKKGQSINSVASESTQIQNVRCRY